ncbi:MAG: ATP-binding protein [Candidatus Micrarchaeota archaeon]
MEYLERILFKELQKWDGRRELFAIKGPRQVGKTTLLEMYRVWLLKKGVNEKNIIFITFEDREMLEKFEKDPLNFVNRFVDAKSRFYFFLDEAHYLHGIGQKIKLIYDKYPNVKIIITGSSSLELISQTAKYLVGRMFSFELLPFNFHEFLLAKDPSLAKIYSKCRTMVRALITKRKNFNIPKNDIIISDLLKYLEEYLIFGGYPAVVLAKNNEEKFIVLKNIFNTYLEKDIISFLQITDSAKFRKIVSILALTCGNILSYNSLATNAGGYFKEIMHIIDVLEQTYIMRRVRPFYANLVTELRKNPKVYFLDSGIRNYAIQNFSELDTRSDKGHLAENFAYNALNEISEGQNLHFWRTTSKAEVDFVVDKSSFLIPVEVKFEPFKKERISKSMRSFISVYSPEFAIIATKDFFGELKIGKTIVKFIPLVYL